MRSTLCHGWLCCCFFCSPTLAVTPNPTPPPLMQAMVYDAAQSLEIRDYWVSEKLDGVRAYWNGRKLVTRGGRPIHAPAWFTANWPAVPLDGELWGGRASFERTSGTVRSETPSESNWRQLKFMVFDLPAHGGVFDARANELRELIDKAASAWLEAIEQIRLSDHAELPALLERIELLGGEGLMLHRGSARYLATRTGELLKYKSHEDAEARVLGYTSGTGKYAGVMGALIVERADGVRFKIGSGFSDAERTNPPPIGAWVTYAYNGLTNTGLPRFARFVRVRHDLATDESRKECIPNDALRCISL